MTRISSLKPLLAMFMITGAACAGTITIDAYGVDWNRGGSIWLDVNGTPNNQYFAGVVSIALNQDDTTYYRDTMCVDLFTDIYIGVTYDSELLQPSQVTTESLERVSWLIDNALLPTQDPNVISDLPTSDWVSSVAQGAGLQLAIWDIANDPGGLGFAAGKVQASTVPGEETDPAALAWAQTYESLSSHGQGTDSAFVYYNWDPNSGAPVQMLEGPMFSDRGPVPDPSAPESSTSVYVFIGMALFGLGHARWLRAGLTRLHSSLVRSFIAGRLSPAKTMLPGSV